MVSSYPRSFATSGFRFFILTLDHGPAHVHVEKAGAEAKLNLLPVVEINLVQGMKLRDLNEAIEIAVEHHAAFLAAWNEVHSDK